ncbi:carboxylate methylbutanoyltransferase mlcH [Psilocybe cubensis]|uniref:Carboxylate methylbutanoyltransferase mlcH n=2 Tax=Psilocybe cubensis TaxID=181762 RepID=A0ACB8GH29_PSICU|nr:carboxylate methylbutanoyltransferase mlcH [Psilocybe cubensis]KAH9474868.1 carboxylate methylbutanoyltransferase mlcH [Psilocybe cubensis]
MVVLTKTGKGAMDNLVAEISRNKRIPGFLFGATSATEEIYLKPSGYNIVNDPASGLINEDSTFALCGQGKIITHLAALQLVERGLVTLETPISDYIPEFADLVVLDDQLADVFTFKPAKTIMRLKHVLNFTSGMFYPLKGFSLAQQPEAYIAPYTKDDPISQFLSFIKGDLPGIPLLFEPGENYVHGWSSDIAGFLVEKITGQTLEEYLQENIFKPLNMKASFYLTPDIKDRLVDMTFRRNDILEAWAAGAATNPILTSKTVEQLFEPVLNEQGSKSLDRFLTMDPFTPATHTQWSVGGFALSGSDLPGRRKKGSGFWIGWAHTLFLIDPASGIATVFGAQIMPAGDREIFEVVAELEEALYAGLSSEA